MRSALVLPISVFALLFITSSDARALKKRQGNGAGDVDFGGNTGGNSDGADLSGNPTGGTAGNISQGGAKLGIDFGSFEGAEYVGQDGLDSGLLEGAGNVGLGGAKDGMDSGIGGATGNVGQGGAKGGLYSGFGSEATGAKLAGRQVAAGADIGAGAATDPPAYASSDVIGGDEPKGDSTGSYLLPFNSPLFHT